MIIKIVLEDQVCTIFKIFKNVLIGGMRSTQGFEGGDDDIHIAN